MGAPAHGEICQCYENPKRLLAMKAQMGVALGGHQADLKVASQLNDDRVCMFTSQFSSYAVARSVMASQYLLSRHSEEDGCEGL
jgi:hypothetical protein